MKRYIEIVADTNVGDGISSRTEVTDETLESIKPVIEAINKFEPYVTEIKGLIIHYDRNFPTKECVRTDLEELSAKEYYVDNGIVNEKSFNKFMELIPCNEYSIYSITDIDIIYLKN